MKRLAAILCALSLIGAAPLKTPPQHQRPEDQTFLTGPEWFLVFSPQEYAELAARGSTSRFPFFAHIGQFWQNYRAVAKETERYPPNYQYHLMIVVIGVSTTVEYGLKGLYEATAGRFSEAVDGSDTAEDKLAARVAADYVAFLKKHAWFDFDFIGPLKDVWTDTGWWGPNPLRKWERKYMLTSEYLAKAGYAWVLRFGSHATYQEVIERTVVWVDRDPAAPPAADGTPVLHDTMLDLPRYQAFQEEAFALAGRGVNFRKIAGNDGQIMLTLLGSDRGLPETGARLLYTQPILTRPGETRYAVALTVPQLAEALRRFKRANIRVEHIYDY